MLPFAVRLGSDACLSGLSNRFVARGVDRTLSVAESGPLTVNLITEGQCISVSGEHQARH